MDDKRCKESGCPGSISANSFVFLQVGGCAVSNMGYPCNVCGRIYYWDNTEPRFSADQKKLFLINGKVIKEDHPVLSGGKA